MTAARAINRPSPQRVVRGIYRYPIKGLSPQALPAIQLEAGKAFPFDRVFALVRPNLPIDPAAPGWWKKGLFLMLMLDEALAQVKTHLDIETQWPLRRDQRGSDQRRARHGHPR